ncbi:MAG: DUF4386 domain-containing protein [Sphingosinicella sp.]
MTEPSLSTYSRLVCLLLIVTMAGGIYGELYVPSLFLTGDVASTAALLRANEGLFRLGFAAYLAEAFSDVVLAWLFYVLLRPVNRSLALLSAFLGLVSMLIFAVTKMLYFSAPVFLGDSLSPAFSPAQQDALAFASLSMYGRLSLLSMLFYGAGWIVRGYLTVRSTFLPRFLGLLMILSGLGFVARTLTFLLAPSLSSDLLLAPMFLNVVLLALWMLFRGVDRARWEEMSAKAPQTPK